MTQTSIGVEQEDHDAFKKVAAEKKKSIKDLFHDVVMELVGKK